MSMKDSNKSLGGFFSQSIFALFCIQIFSTLSFSVLYSTLVLYMTGPLHLTAQYANSIMGVFVAFNFALHLLGGYWGGRFLSYRALFCVGMLAQIIGCLLLAFVRLEYLYYGLAAFLTGAGLNVTCLNCMLTQRFKPEDIRRESAFLYNYAGMNIGFFAGFSLSGYFQLLHNYHRLFLLSSIGNLAALLICLYYWHALADKYSLYAQLDKGKQIRSSLKGLLMVCCLPFILSPLLHFADLANKLVLITGITMVGVIYWLAFKQPEQEAREKIFAFGILMIIGIVFWMLYQIGPMGLTHFIDHNVQRHWLMLTIPPQWFQNINTICIVVGGPLLSLLFNRMRARGVYINIPMQFAFALFLIGAAFAILPMGIANANDKGLVGPEWIVMSFVLQSAGELLISPIGYAMVGALAPSSLQGVMMGIWMLSTGVGATLSSYSSNWMTVGHNTVNPLVTNAGYSHVFLILGCIAIVASISLFLLSPIVKRWMNDKNQVTKDDVSLIAV
ncbi:peptide MFS transporter [Legionella gresilensis]|uniref:peptide MFS transporter n=1 Tax=Legionella gresilensis TaxID=91823 RepID=UPI0010412752|nr:oligopeptide:H+ symporter [Legionella gresilensis]